jgi:hypothetical protein
MIIIKSMNKTFWNLLKENWVIILTVGSFIVTVLSLQDGYKNHESRIEKLENTKVTDALNIAEINSRLSSIETSLIFIKEAVKEK